MGVLIPHSERRGFDAAFAKLLWTLVYYFKLLSHCALCNKISARFHGIISCTFVYEKTCGLRFIIGLRPEENSGVNSLSVDDVDDDDGRINFNVAYSPKTARTRSN